MALTDCEEEVMEMLRQLPRSNRGERSRRVGLTALAAICVTVGAALAFSPAGGAVGSLLQNAVSDPPPPVAGPSEPGGVAPTLSAADEAKAKQILAADPRSKRFLAGRGYTVEKVGPWTSLNDEPLGAVMQVKLDRPAAFPMTDWPVMIYDREEKTAPPFRTGTFPAAASHVTELTLQVDLSAGRVVGILPTGDSAVTRPRPEDVRTRP